MSLFEEAFIDQVGNLVHKQHQALAKVLGDTGASNTPLPLNSPLHQHLTLLISVANGEQIRAQASAEMLSAVEQALKSVVHLLLDNVLHTQANIPDEFWQSDLGILISRVRWWLSADDLITISNAAAIAFGENSQANRMRIARAIERGVLEWIPDPSVANPQHNRRVLRSQVERLRAQSTLPE